MNRTIINHITAKLLVILTVIAAATTAKANTVTVEIDDISRVAVKYLVTETWTYEDAEGFCSGSNRVEIPPTISAIAFKATDGNEIVNVHYTLTEGYAAAPGLDASARDGMYMLYLGFPDWEDALIKVTSTNAVIMTAVINVDNASAINLKNSAQDVIPLHDGKNTISFTSINNPFYVMKMDEYAIMSVFQNEDWVLNGDSNFVILNLADGDVINIYTDGTTGEIDDSNLYPDPDTLVTELPKSRFIMMYSRSSTTFSNGKDESCSGLARSIVFDTSGNQNIYLENPITGLDTEAYLLGFNNNGTIEIRLPQLLYDKDGTKLWAYRLDASDDGYSINPDVKQIIRLRGEGDQTWHMIAGEGEDFILGLCTADSVWAGYGEKELCYAPLVETVATAPRGTSYNPYILQPGNSDISVAITVANEVFVKGIFPACADSAINGTLKNGVASFTSGQYLGIYDGWHVYFQAIHENGEIAESLDMEYDSYEGKFTSADGSGYIVVRGNNIVTPVEVFSTPSFSKKTSGTGTNLYDAPASVEYIDINGHKAMKPVKGGVYIKVSTAADGSISTQKVVF